MARHTRERVSELMDDGLKPKEISRVLSLPFSKVKDVYKNIKKGVADGS